MWFAKFAKKLKTHPANLTSITPGAPEDQLASWTQTDRPILVCQNRTDEEIIQLLRICSADDGRDVPGPVEDR
jgi:hypothetical protein